MVIYLVCLPALVLVGCSGPQVAADPSWTPAVVFVTPTSDAALDVEPTPLNIPTVRYRIRRGETLTEIAARYNLTVEELAALNEIDNPNSVQVGQEIRVPRRPR